MRKLYSAFSANVSRGFASASIAKKTATSALLITMFCLVGLQKAEATNYYSKASATNFGSLSSWGPNTDGTGISPSAFLSTDDYIVQNGSTIALSSGTLAIRSLTINSGTCTISGGILTVQITSPAVAFNSFVRIVSPGTLAVSGGTLNIMGQLHLASGGTFSQSGGNINIDGNNAGGATGSITGTAATAFTAAGTASAIVTFEVLNSASVNLTGGALTIVDPQQSGNEAFRFAGLFAGQTNTTASHTTNFGNNTSTDAGNATNGFFLNNWNNTTGFRFGNVNVRGGTTGGPGTGRHVNAGWNASVTSTFGAFIALGNLTIDANGEFRNQIAAPTAMCVGGNLVNNGVLTTTVGAAVNFGSAFYTSGTVITAAPATTSQVVSGTGIFRNNLVNASSTANYGGLIFNNTSAAGVQFSTAATLLYQSAPVTNTGTNSGALTFTNGVVDLNGRRYIHGSGTAATGGTISVAQGGFVNGSMTRWLGTSTLTTSATAPTTTITFPFAAANGAPRGIGLNQSAVLTTAGYLSASYTDASGLNTGVSFTDAGYSAQGGTTINRRTNASWTLSTANVTGLAANTIVAAAQTFPMSINPNGVILLTAAPIANGAPVICAESATAPGTHATGSGTAAAPIASRTGNTLTNLTGTTYYVGLNSGVLDPFYTIASGTWATGATWSGGAAPSASNPATITSGNDVTLGSGTASAYSLQINGSGSLSISGGNLNITSGIAGSVNGLSVNNASGKLSLTGGTATIGTTGQRVSTLNCAGTLTVASGATLNVNGNLLMPTASTLNQTGGDINIDGNNGRLNYASTGTATSSGAVITLATGNTTNLSIGDVVTVAGGTGTFAVGTTVSSLTANTITVSPAPTVTLSGAAIVSAAQSVASATALCSFQSQLLNLTGGNLTILNPHLNGTTIANNRALEYNNGVNIDLGSGHTTRFGNGSATLNGNATAANGFNVSGQPSLTGRLAFGNLTVNGTAIASNLTTLTGGSSSASVVTVASTTGLAIGSLVTVTTGTGVFAANTTVATITGPTTFTVSTAPTTALSGATITAAPNNRQVTVVTPTPLGVLGNLLVTGTDAEFRFNSNIVNVAGNVTNDVGNTITNNGTLGLLNFASNAATPSTNAQTVSGAGRFRNSSATTDALTTACHAAITINNTNANGVTFSGNAVYNSALGGGNAGTHVGVLTFTQGTLKVIGSNPWFIGHGVTTPAVASVSVTAGGFGNGTTVARWFPSLNAGSTITSASNPTSTGTLGSGAFPFVSGTGATQVSRHFNIARSTTTGDAAGTIRVKYIDSDGATSISQFTDGAKNINTLTNSNWVVTTGNGFAKGTAEVNKLAATVNGIFTVLNNANLTIVSGATPSEAATIAGSSREDGLASAMNAHRAAIPSSTALAGIYYVGYDISDAPIQTQQSGAWNSVNTWVGGIVPTCPSNVQIQNTHNITVPAECTASVGSVILSGNGTLDVQTGGILNVGCTGNNAVLSLTGTSSVTVSGGDLNINGSIDAPSGTTFAQSSGTIKVDGNDNGNIATSVATGTNIVNIAGIVSLSGGTLTIVDPHAGSATTDRVFSYNSSANASAIGHTLQFGDGTSTTSTINPNGFAFEGFTGTGRLNFGSIVVNTNATATNSRFVTTAFSTAILGDLTITSGEFRPGSTYSIGGNLINSGTLTSASTLSFQSASGTAAAINTVAQTVSGLGIYRNTIPTATVSAGGSGYVVGDLLTISGGTFSTAATFRVTAVSSGAVSSVVSVGTGVGYTAAPTNPAATSGGSGTGATLTLSSLLSTANFSGLTINNNHNNGVTFSNANSLVSGNNSGTVSGALTFTQGFINTGSNAFVLGTTATSVGTLSYTAGGFGTGSTFSRWLGTATGGSTITASSNPSGATGQYPFVIGSITGATVKDRSFFLNQTATSTTGGIVAVSYTDAATLSTVSYTDATGPYTVNSVSDAYWNVSTNGITGTPTYSVAANISGVYTTFTNNSRLVVGGSSMNGAHIAASASTIIPTGQRTGISLANLSGNIKIGINSTDIPWISQGSGTLDWNTTSTWNKGTIPSVGGSVIIDAGTTVAISSNVSASVSNVTINSTGTLNIAANLNITGSATTGFVNNGTVVLTAGTVNVGITDNTVCNRTLTNNGVLTVSGGALNVFGNISNSTTSTFTQSGGSIKIDGNAGGVSANSVASTTPLLYFNNPVASTNVNLTGGTLTIVDPHANSTLTESIRFDAAFTGQANVTTGHTLIFGDGSSSDAGGNTSGFFVDTWFNNGGLAFGNLIINGPTGTNRSINSNFQQVVIGNMTVNSGGQSAIASTWLNGNLTVNTGGIFTSTALLNLVNASYAGGSLSVIASTNAQIISGAGTFGNLATSSTASLTNLTINNTNATGVTLNAPLSVSGTLTFTSGIVNTSNTNLLTLGTATAAGTLVATTSFGSSSYINGPFARTFAASKTLSATYDNTLLFPIGKSASFAPVYMNPVTASTGAVTLKAESFNSNSGSTVSPLGSLPSKRWELSPSVGSANLTSVRLKVEDQASAFGTYTVLVSSSTAAGQYDQLLGSGYNAGTPNFLLSSAIAAADFNQYFSYADLQPCNGTPNTGGTIASDITTACLTGNPILNLSSQATNPGISYQWASSTTQGGPYTNITSETNSTYNASNVTATTYYVCKSICTVSSSVVGTRNSNEVALTVLTPSVSASAATGVCGTGTSTLSATPSSGASLVWYNASNVQIGTGSPLISPSINTSTDFTVKAQQGTVTTTETGLGLNDGQVPAAIGAFAERGIVFTANKAFTIVSAQYYSPTLSVTNTVSVKLVNNTTGIQIGSTLSLPIVQGSTAGFYTMNLNISVPSAGSYRLLASFSSSVNRVSTGADYTSAVYNNLGSFGTITSGFDGSASSTIYNYFHNISITGSAPCLSDPTTVTAVQSTAPTFTVTSPITVCNNALATIAVTSSPANDYTTVSWSTPSPTVSLTSDAAGNTAISTTTSPTNIRTVYLKTTTAGTYTFNANSSGGGASGTCSNTQPIVVNVLAAGSSVSVIGNDICRTGTTDLTASPTTNLGTNIQWLDGSNQAISGANETTYTTPTLTSSTNYGFQVKDGSNNICFTKTNTVNVNNPVVSNPIAASRCGTGTVNLQATASSGSTLNWYTVATGGTSLGTGFPFTTPSISATTSYWVDASAGGGSDINVGPTSPTAQGGTIATQTVAWNINFTTLSSTTLQSVTIYPIATGQSGVIQIRQGSSASGTQVGTDIPYTTSVSGGSTPQVIPVNIAIPTAGDYNIYTSTLPSSGVSRNTSGQTYPVSSSIANITGNGFDNTYWMGVYDWVFSGGGCASARTEVVATITTPPSLALVNTSFTNCGTAISNTTATSGTIGNYNQYVWSAADVNTTISKLSTTSGGSAYTGTTLSSPNIYSNPTATGVYTYTLTATKNGAPNAGCSNTATYTVTINAVPTITAIANPTDVLTGGSSTLSSTNSTGTVVWSIPPSTSSVSTSQTNINSTTTYRATITASNTCTATSNVTVNVVSCAPPTIGTPTVSSNSAASIPFTGNLAATTYLYQYRIQGTSTWTQGTVSASPISLTGLSGGYTYEIQMASGCAGPSTSTYSASTTFTMNLQPLNTYIIARNPSISYSSIAQTGSPFTGWATSGTFPTDENLSGALSLPSGFNFRYQGKAVTTLRAHVNGYVVLDEGFTNQTSVSSSGISVHPRCLAPFAADLVTAGNPGSGNSGNATVILNSLNNSILYQISGTTGSRVLTIEWIGLEQFTIPGPNLNFQLKLYEGTSKVEFVYGDMWPYNGGTSTSWSYRLGISDYTTSSTFLNQQAENVLNFTQSTTNSNVWVPKAYSSLTFTPGTTVQTYNASALTVSNNEIATATSISGLSVGESTDYNATYTFNGATANANPATLSSGSWTNTTNPDVWYKLVATSTTDSVFVRLLGSSSLTGKIELRDGTTNQLLNASTSSTSVNGASASMGAGLTCVAGAIPTSVGQVILVRIINTASTTTLGVNYIISAWTKAVPLANDDCSGATTLTIGSTLTSGSTSNATVSANVPANCGGSSLAGDVWYKFTATSTFTNVTTVPGSGFNLGIEIWNGGSGGGSCITNSTSTTNRTCLTPTGAGQTRSQDLTTVVGNTYYIRVYSGASGGITPSTGFSITVTTPLPGCATGLASLGTSRNVTITTPLTWTAATNATTYTVVLADNSSYSSPIVNTTVATTSYSVPANTFSTSTTYYWKVTANGINGSASGCSSNTAQFSTLGSTPSCVSINSPANLSSSTTASNGVTLSWTAGSGSPTSYDVYFGTNQALVTASTPSVRIAQGVGITSINTLSNGITLLDGTTYYWKVNAINANGTNTGCSANSFSTRSDLTVSSTQSISGSYNDVTITGTGIATLSGTLDVSGVLTVANGATLILGNNIITGTTTNIQSGSNVRVGSTLGIAAAGSSTGNIQTTTRTIASGVNFTFNGTSGAQITGSGMPSTINNLIISNSNGVTVNSGSSSQLNVTGILTVSTGNLNANGLLTLKSTSIANTAIVAPVTGSITGNVIVERYIPKGYRGFREISAGVANAGSMFNNWQEAGAYTSGTGIFITGEVGTSKGFNATTGIDYTANGVSSASFFDNSKSTGNWTNITSTIGTSLNPYQPYRVLVRGDRSFDMFSVLPILGINGNLGMVNATAIRSTGRLITGNVVYSSTGVANSILNSSASKLNSSSTTAFSVIANPYVCPVDLSSVTSTGIEGNGTSINKFYYFDPTFSSTGTYVTVLDGVTTPIQSKVTTILQPGQAIYVRNNGSTTPTITFTENAKVTNTTPTGVFGTNSINRMDFTLLRKLPSDSIYSLTDGAVAVFKAGKSNSYSSNEDAAKLNNANDNISIVHSNVNLSIDGRPLATANDSVILKLGALSTKAYQLQVDGSSFTANGLTAYLYDAYLKSTSALTVGVNKINFTVDNTVAASYTNRFGVIFKPTAPLSVKAIYASATLKNEVATINWNTQGEEKVATYTVEKSTDAKNFNKVGEAVVAKNSNTASYSADDKNIVSSNTYYRIKATNLDGTVQYSNIAQLKKATVEATYSLYPNPLKGKALTVQMNNVAAGKYTVIIYNALGQKVVNQVVIHEGGIANHAINIGTQMSAGVYTVSILGSEGKVSETKLSVE